MNSKVALVTGAGRGLGFAFVKRLLSEGYRVVAACREGSTPALQEIASENLTVLQMDVEDDASIEQTIQRVSQITPSIDLLINNAGVNSDTVSPDNPNKVRMLEELDRSLLNKMFNINAIGPVMVTKAFLPLLKSAPQGFVINISSERASFNERHKDHNYNNYGYAASKAALNMYTYDLAHDLQRHGISIFCLDPGSMKTDMNPGGEISPDQAAEKILSIYNNFTPELNGRFLDNTGKLMLQDIQES